jgi:two-component system chemotaxis sensor kinase CheA
MKNGLLEPDDLINFNDTQALQLAFRPGISTAKKVTEISGRGVGLDVAKSKIESLGGSIKVETTIGNGTKFTIKLPPSMSIISAMLVEINRENYAIPLENLNETTKLAKTDIHKFLENGMFRLREEILPLLNMHSEFGGDLSNLTGDLPVIIVEKEDNRVGLVVSKLIGQQEIVVKNLNRNLNHSKYFSGATILGDGNVALILDVGSLL